MKSFVALYLELDSATSTARKLAALVRYFSAAPAEDAAWAAYFLAGGKPRQAVNTRVLRMAAAQAAAIPDWLFEECYDAVGDLAETIALVLPPPAQDVSLSLDRTLRERILPLRGQPPEAQAAGLHAAWQEMDADSRFVFNKLITGAFRVGVSRLMVTQALSRVSGVPKERIAQRMIAYLASHAQPDANAWRALVDPQEDIASGAQPYPFFLAQSLQVAPATQLGEARDWQAEWKWDGMRGQLVRRGGAAQLWSRGDELITERFPELMEMAQALPDGCVLDGEVIGWEGTPAGEGAPLPFARLQTRMSRKRLSAKFLAETPIVFIAYDLLEVDGRDIRATPLRERRARLAELVTRIDEPRLRLSPVIDADDWEALAAARAEARARGAEGLMLKRHDSAYSVGRSKRETRGEWWKWKLDPMSVDAVLVYAQSGHGRRASLYTDYSFAVWDAPAGTAGRQLTPFAKAYSGLSDAEIREVDAFIRANTLEKFGPVRTVRPALVMEIGFEGIAASKRHKSGVAVRFPRILRIRHDKTIEQADSLAELAALMTLTEPGADIACDEAEPPAVAVTQD
ncbi:ATP-dependent DNA ligase [Uliginosibacterium sp. H1]|uniref:ATP-dependent DNA ligase n=1 Tax=Uliginosibacterium sp. H1 TaxID=3114757 RepID=UPI002E18E636|nr:ATP-dependent DNA ligase [Uliginosibacterium sp. H1]